MHILSKSTYIKGEQCSKALYLFKKHPYLRDKLSLEKRAKFKRGTDVGILARSLFPGGINMAPSSPSQFQKMFQKTMENINNPDVNVMYEAVFIHDDTLIMLDVIVREGEKWRAIEVKSSLSISETYLNDAALQYYVLKGCNIPISDIQLMYVNANYVRDGDLDLEQLFVYESVKEYAEEKLPYIKNKIRELKETLELSNSPHINIGTHCFKPYTCEFLGHCWKKVPENSYLYTNALNDKDMFSLYNCGIQDNRSFKRYIDPLSLGMNQIDALEQNTFYINYKKFYNLIEKKNKSIAFLNVLIYSQAIPSFNGHKPYQNIMPSFSILSDENDEVTEWNCLNDFSKIEEGLSILAEKLLQYDQIFYFSSQNLNHLLQHNNISQLKDISYKLTNLRDVLISSDFFHKKTKYDFSLKNVFEGIFEGEKCFEHSRIILNATSDNEIERILVGKDMEDENIILKRVYRRLIG